MKTRNSFRFFPVPLVAIGFSSWVTTQAATSHYWNVGGTGGDGNWGTSPGDKNWNLVPGAAAGNTFWPDTINDFATFQDAVGGTVTVLDPVQTAGISQDGANYTINAGTITLVRDSFSSTPRIIVAAGTLTIDSVLAGSEGMNKSGIGNLVLSGANTFTGTTTLADGTLTLTGSLASSTIEISGGASLLDQSGGLAANTVLGNSSNLVVSVAETVATYTQTSAAGLLSGTGTLTVTNGATLQGGLVSGTLLGDVTVSGGGTVQISGTVGGGLLKVESGTLELTGNSQNTVVEISGAGFLTDTNAGLSSDAVVTNAGTLAVNSAETLSKYVQNGSGVLAGISTLTVADGATLNGGKVSGTLLGNTTSSGVVSVSGILGGGALSVTGGTLKLTGISTNNTVDISAPASLIDSNGGLDDFAIVSNSGTLVVGSNDQVRSYAQNGGGVLAGRGVLTAWDGATLNGGNVSGNLMGDTVIAGEVQISGTVGGGDLTIVDGTLTLSGRSKNVEVTISPDGYLIDAYRGLDKTATVTNAGTLTLRINDEVDSYISNGGTLEGGYGTLITKTTLLNDGSVVIGDITTRRLTIDGSIFSNAWIVADEVVIKRGIVYNSGLLGASWAHMDLAAGATLIANGQQLYSLFTTSGPGTAIWQGNLVNPATIAPGGIGPTGKLRVVGNFTNTSDGTLRLDVGATGHDLLEVTGTATFDGKLNLNQTGVAEIASSVPITVVDATRYEGNFTSLEENLDGSVWFNPENGTVTRVASPEASGKFLFGTTKNQSAAWISLYDDVIDPGKVNITHTQGLPPKYEITSGIANPDYPDLLWALAASLTPAGLNADLLNRLSPEVFAAFADYPTQATRTHQRTALTAPALATSRSTDSKAAITDSAKSSAKGAILPARSTLDWEFFAAADYFKVETDHSRNLADYELSGAGMIGGARTHVSDRVQLAAYVAGDDGSVNGSLIHSDGSGWSIGLVGESLLDEKSQTLLTTAISYGRYCFDGTRESVAANSAGWSPGRVHFSDVASDSLELFAGIETTVYQNEKVRVIPSAGLRYAAGRTDGFKESTRAATGFPIALDVDSNSYDSLLAEFGVAAETDLTEELTIRGQLGFNAGIGEDTYDISASFARGRRPIHADAEGLSDDLMFIDLGANYRINESVSVGVGYRAEIRSDVHAQQGWNISSTFRF